MFDVIDEAARYFSVIMITGPRHMQSGKTTLIRNEFKQLPYYSLENLDVRSYAENAPVVFLNLHTEGMVLDEVHNAPNLLSYIQGIVDEHPKRRFILSVSSQFAMLKKSRSRWQDVPQYSNCCRYLILKYWSILDVSHWTTCCLKDFTRPSMLDEIYRNTFIRPISRPILTRMCATYFKSRIW